MKFFAGFMVGTISGVALQLFQSKNVIPSINDTKLFNNIKDFKDILVDLQKNSAIVPEVMSGIQKDIADYSQSIQPDVENLQDSLENMKENLEELNKI
ncbi:hypothetical protein [Companilactobacillus kimchiensis]|uniref:Uncharacterized protein n=1 Tax=Companilactobacillus kimchiensis TaxID=993692 RepID=A0A0R2LCX2_9LACO|nr:hypothetical protein [Companilactobacillus kimchiensis]KRN99752.1 hypothetical protein IV57_GL002358 [Companilactobacillus kimchiensis]